MLFRLWTEDLSLIVEVSIPSLSHTKLRMNPSNYDNLSVTSPIWIKDYPHGSNAFKRFHDHTTTLFYFYNITHYLPFLKEVYSEAINK